ncbi:MAG: BamA/TamA family outer membrane protein, partial [Burkholderiales bacterium]
YPYQKLGRIENGDPVGGRAFLEASTELRLKLHTDWGLVGFLDAGNVYDTSYPTFNESLKLGAGVGLRYFTKFGPLRADIAIPINKRKGIDDDYQIYLSIGQAF